MKISKTGLMACMVFAFFLMFLPLFANMATTTRIIPQRYYYIGFDYDPIDIIIDRAKIAHIDGILAGKREFVNKGITDAKIQEIQAQGIQVFLLWQPTNDNNSTHVCSVAEMRTSLDCRFWDVTDQLVADARITQLQALLNEFPSLNGIHLEEPTIQLNDIGCDGRTIAGDRTFASLAPKFTAFLQRVRSTMPANMHFSMNSPSLDPFGNAKWCAGLDFTEYDGIGLFDFISLQTGGALLPTEYMPIVNSWQANFPNTIIIPGVYGWDAGIGGTRSRSACIAAGGYAHRDCYNNDFLNAIYNIQVINNSRVAITQVHWPISADWINNASSYPCSTGSWNLACAVGEIFSAVLPVSPPYSPPSLTYVPAPAPAPCIPTKNCASYPGQCSANTDDGCGTKINCWNNCAAPLICSYGVCVNPSSPPIVSYKPSIPYYSWPDLFNGITNWTLGIVASLTLLFLIIGGLFYITSAGDEQRMAFSKKVILAALIGFAVIILSAALVSELKKIL